MAKAERKKNRKLRRRVRRTTAIVMLITSVIVAAIPVPENAAAPSSSGSARANEHNTDGQRYEYGYDVNTQYNAETDQAFINAGGISNRQAARTAVKAVDKLSAVDDIGGVSLAPGSSTTIDKYSYVFEYEGEYIYQKDQFDLYNVGASSSVINDYNDNYNQIGNGKVEIPNFLCQDYEVVTDAMLIEFDQIRRQGFTVTLGSPNYIKEIKYNDISGNSHTLTAAGLDINDLPALRNDGNDHLIESSSKISTRELLTIIQKYFANSTDYTGYVARYNAHIAQQGNSEETWIAGNNDVELSFSYINDAQRLEYYCDMVRTSVDAGNGFSMAGCVLRRVTETGNENAVEYIPQVNVDTTDPGVTAGMLTVDANGESTNNKKGGFVCGGRSRTITGIADYAFFGVRNLKELILPPNLQTIGDSAFEHSFITTLSGSGLRSVGNRAFKSSELNKLDLTSGGIGTIGIIGTEAFSGTKLSTFKIPDSLETMGPGAFSGCKSLASLEAETNTISCEIGDFSFYDCNALATVDWKGAGSGIKKIGKAAFALSQGPGGMREFSFPALGPDENDKDGDSKILGNYILAGQDNLERVYMPYSSWADSNTKPFDLPKYTFVDCRSLKFVDFTTGGSDMSNTTHGRAVSYDPYMFYEVENTDFYVRGPQWYRSGELDPAKPRASTWSAVTMVSNQVPYVYYNQAENVDYYEIDDKSYVNAVNTGTGMLVSVITSPSNDGSDMTVTIPGTVGSTVVKGISSEAFEQDPKVKQEMTGLVIKSGGEIASIADNAFAGCPKLP